MDVKYQVKKAIINSRLNKKRNKNPVDFDKDELYQLVGDEPWYMNNSYFFGGYSLKNNVSLVLRLGIRNNNPYEVFLFYRNNNYFLVTPKDYYDDNPFCISCIKPQKIWNVRFKEKLLDKNTNKLHDVELIFNFENRREIYDFFYSHSSRYMTDSICRCKWNKNFKEEMNKVEQRHYEQSGYLKGEISIDGEKETFVLPGGRDHSFGLRDWNAMHDHIWLFALTENGEIFNYSVVNYPILKNIHNGYTDLNRKELVSIDKIYKLDYSCNGGMGVDELDLEVVFCDKKVSKIHVHRVANQETHYQNGDYYFQEGFAEFDIDGVKLIGTVEYGFNKNKGKWEIKNI